MASRTPANARSGRNAPLVNIADMTDHPSDGLASEAADGGGGESEGERDVEGEDEEDDEEEEEEEVQGETDPVSCLQKC